MFGSAQFGHKWNPVYQRFCVNMEKQRGFVKALHQLPDFQEYIRVRIEEREGGMLACATGESAGACGIFAELTKL